MGVGSGRVPKVVPPIIWQALQQCSRTPEVELEEERAQGSLREGGMAMESKCIRYWI